MADYSPVAVPSVLNFVRHPKKPGWGIGRVLSDEGTDLIVYFESVGPKKLRMALTDLDQIPDSDIDAADLLRHVKSDATGAFAVPPLTFDEMVGNFLRIEGGGFDCPKYISDERVYKEEAVSLASSLLERDRLRTALKDANPTLVHEAYKKVVQATNLLSLFEKARLSSLPPSKHGAFAEPFAALLVDDGPFNERFDKMAEAFVDLGIGSWPTCTYALFMTHPNEHLIVKPTFVQRAATALGYEISYDSCPTAATYSRILGFASYVREKLSRRDMTPRDMIDVQGFIWLGTGGADKV